MTLSTAEAQKIIKERTYFDETITLENGEVIRVKFNDAILDRIVESTQMLLGLRGVKNTLRIDENDKDVKALVKKKKQELSRAKRKLTPQDNEKITRAVVQQFIQQHDRPFQESFYQVVIWAIVADDIFTVSVDERGNDQLEYRIEDVVVPEEYWEPAAKSSIDGFLQRQKVFTPYLDRGAPLEHMIAVVQTMFNDYSDFKEKITPKAKVALAAALNLMSEVEYDSAGFLHAELDRILGDEVESGDGADNQANSGGGVPDVIQFPQPGRLVEASVPDEQGSEG